jgi:hypothetical protein
MLQTFAQLFQRKGGLTPRTVADSVKLLQFLTLLCEGHHQKAQEYLGNNRVVGEVANFVADINKIFANEISSIMVDHTEFPQKLFPKVLNKYRSIIKWINPFPDFNINPNTNRKTKESTNNSAPKSKCKLINLEKLALLAEVITAGLEALSEFCQGPRPEIQLIVARAAATREFSTFFSFFGAYHLHTHYKDIAYKTSQQKQSFQKLYTNSVKYAVSSEQLFEVPNDKLMWYGHDPLGVNLLMQYANEQSSEGNEEKSRALFELGGLLQISKLFSKPVSGLADILDDESMTSLELEDRMNHPDFHKLEFWVEEKGYFVNYRKKNSVDNANDSKSHSISTNNIEKNWYEKVSDFERAMIKFESSCVKLAMSLLESAVADDIFEIPKIVVHNIGIENLVCNMSNFWNRFLAYAEEHGDSLSEACFEKKLAFDYYSLIMRIDDLSFENNLRKYLDEWRVSTNIRVDEVSI